MAGYIESRNDTEKARIFRRKGDVAARLRVYRKSKAERKYELKIASGPTAPANRWSMSSPLIRPER